MNKTTHTPGPWNITYNGTYGPYVDAPYNDKSGYGAASHDVGIETDSICAPRGPNAKANAQLIAAAPDLLDALEKLRAAWVRTDSGQSLAMAHAMKKANSAIASAKGEA